jgi:uncharacterized short protein YbdD (DUF466 family)
MVKTHSLLGRIWKFAGELFGDKAYDRYAEYVRSRGEEPLSREEFYLSQLQRKYSRPCRCC